jgi:hypothetical protein
LFCYVLFLIWLILPFVQQKDPVFDAKQIGIWTGDENDSAGFMDGAWSVRFTGGYGGGNACWVYDNASNHVRPIRSVK